MSNLQRYDNNGIELLIDQETGEVFSSVAGYARMADKSKGTISDRLSTVRNLEVKTAEIHTTTGFKTVRLIPENIIMEWIIKDNPELARQMMGAGVRVFLYKLAGYEIGVKKDSQVMMEQMMKMMADLTQEVKELKEKSHLWDNLNNTTSNNFPGLKGMNDSLSLQPGRLADNNLYSVNQWLDLNQIEMDKSEFHDFCNVVAANYRVIKGKKPEKVEITYPNGYKSEVNGFTVHEFFILQQSLIEMRK